MRHNPALFIKNSYIYCKYGKHSSVIGFINFFRTFLLLGMLYFMSIQTVFAQYNDETIRNYDSNKILYNSERSFTTRFQTNGFAMAWNTGKIRTYYKTNTVHYELGWLRSPREIRQRFDVSTPFSNAQPKAFVFGKINSLYVARVGWGQTRYFSDKARSRGVSVGMHYDMGVVLGILKPIYLDLIRYRDNGSTAYISKEKYSEENKDLFLDVTRIVGGSGFLKGLDEVQLAPGGYLRSGLVFEFDAFPEWFAKSEVGFQLDVFPQTVKMLANNPNRLLFLNLYITLELGKRN